MPKGTIDLASLYSGNITSFHIPDKQWLIDNGWASEYDAQEPLFFKRFELFLPYGSQDGMRAHVTKVMMGDNVITKGGTTYDFTTPVRFDLRYQENPHNCFNLLIQNPYQTPNCEERPEICIISKGWNKGSAFHVSVYSRWDLTLRVGRGTLPPVDPVGDFYLQAGVTLCKVYTTTIDSPTESQQPSEATCCADNDKFYDQVTQSCKDCPEQGCPELDGYFCGNCTDPWPF